MLLNYLTIKLLSEFLAQMFYVYKTCSSFFPLLSIRDGSIYIPVHVFSNVPVPFILPIVEVVLSCTPSISKEHIYMAYYMMMPS
jgi:hypothetical protein